MFSKDLELVIGTVYKNCRERREATMTVEHLLLGLAENPGMRATWSGLKANVSRLRKGISAFLAKEIPRLSQEEFTDAEPTLAFQRVLQRAVYHVQSKGELEVNSRDVLIALFGEKDSKAVELLNAQGITRVDAVNLIREGIIRAPRSKDEQIEHRLFEIIVQDLDMRAASPALTIRQPRIFVSYSHADQEALGRLMVHLRPLERDNIVDCWSDRKINAGDQWRAEISRELGDADVAILLISADFLASDFIAKDELPPLLLKAEAKGVRILPVILKPCGFVRHKVLSSFQCVNDPTEPLLGLTHIGQEAVYDKIVDAVYREISLKK